MTRKNDKSRFANQRISLISKMSESFDGLSFSETDSSGDIGIGHHVRFQNTRALLSKISNGLFLLLYMLTKQNTLLSRIMIFLMLLDFVQLLSFAVSSQFTFQSPVLQGLQFVLQFTRPPLHLLPQMVNYAIVGCCLILIVTLAAAMIVAIYRLSGNEQSFPLRLLFILRLAATVMITGAFVPMLSVFVRVPFSAVVDFIDQWRTTPSEAQTNAIVTVLVVIISLVSIVPFSGLCLISSVAFYPPNFQEKWDFLSRPHMRTDFILLATKTLITISFAVLDAVPSALVAVCLAISIANNLFIIIMAPYYRTEMNYMRSAMTGTFVGFSVGLAVTHVIPSTVPFMAVIESAVWVVSVIVNVALSQILMAIRYRIVRPPHGDTDRQIKRIQRSFIPFWTTALCYAALNPEMHYRQFIKRAIFGVNKAPASRRPSVRRPSRVGHGGARRRSSVSPADFSKGGVSPGGVMIPMSPDIELMNPDASSTLGTDDDDVQHSMFTPFDRPIDGPQPPRQRQFSVSFTPGDQPSRRRDSAPSSRRMSSGYASAMNTTTDAHTTDATSGPSLGKGRPDPKAGRFTLTYSYDMDGAERCFEAARSRHPKSAWVLTAYCNFVFIKGNSHMAYFVLNKLGTLRPWADLRYTIYRLHRDHEQLQGTGLTTGANDQASALRYVQFQKTMKLAQRYQHEAGDMLLRFWQTLLHGYESRQTFAVADRLLSAFTGAQNQYNEMMRRFTNVPDLLRGYAWFLETLAYDKQKAIALAEQAADLERKDGTEEAHDTGHGGYDDTYSMYTASETSEEDDEPGMSGPGGSSETVPQPLMVIPEGTEQGESADDGNSTRRTDVSKASMSVDRPSGQGYFPEELIEEEEIEYGSAEEDAQTQPPDTGSSQPDLADSIPTLNVQHVGPGGDGRRGSSRYHPPSDATVSRDEETDEVHVGEGGLFIPQIGMPDQVDRVDPDDFSATTATETATGTTLLSQRDPLLPDLMPSHRSPRMTRADHSSPRVSPSPGSGRNRSHTSGTTTGTGTGTGINSNASSRESLMSNDGSPLAVLKQLGRSRRAKRTGDKLVITPRAGVDQGRAVTTPRRMTSKEVDGGLVSPRGKARRQKSQKEKEEGGGTDRERRGKSSDSVVQGGKSEHTVTGQSSSEALGAGKRRSLRSTPRTPKSSRGKGREAASPRDGDVTASTIASPTQRRMSIAPGSGTVGHGSPLDAVKTVPRTLQRKESDEPGHDEGHEPDSMVYAPTELVYGLGAGSKASRVKGGGARQLEDLKAYFERYSDGDDASNGVDEGEAAVTPKAKTAGLIRLYLIWAAPLGMAFIAVLVIPCVLVLWVSSDTSNMLRAVKGWKAAAAELTMGQALIQRSATVAVAADMITAVNGGFGATVPSLGLLDAVLAAHPAGDRPALLRAYGAGLAYSAQTVSIAAQRVWNHVAHTAAATISEDSLATIRTAGLAASVAMLGLTSDTAATLTKPCGLTGCTPAGLPDLMSGVPAALKTQLDVVKSTSAALPSQSGTLKVSDIYSFVSPDIEEVLTTAGTARPVWVPEDDKYISAGAPLVDTLDEITAAEAMSGTTASSPLWSVLPAAQKTALASIAPDPVLAHTTATVLRSAGTRTTEAGVAPTSTGVHTVCDNRIRATGRLYLGAVGATAAAFIGSAGLFAALLLVLLVLNRRIIATQHHLVEHLQAIPKPVIQALIIATGRHLGMDTKVTDGNGPSEGQESADERSERTEADQGTPGNRWPVISHNHSTSKQLIERKAPILTKRPAMVIEEGQKRLASVGRATVLVLVSAALAFGPVFIACVVYVFPLQGYMVGISLVHDVAADVSLIAAIGELLSSSAASAAFTGPWATAALTGAGLTDLASISTGWNVGGQLDAAALRATINAAMNDLQTDYEALVHGDVLQYTNMLPSNLGGSDMPAPYTNWRGLLTQTVGADLLFGQRCLLGDSCTLTTSVDAAMAAFISNAELLALSTTPAILGSEAADRVHGLALVLPQLVSELQNDLVDTFNFLTVAAFVSVIGSFCLSVVVLLGTIVISAQTLRSTAQQESLKVQIVLRSIPPAFLRWSPELRQVVDATS